MLTNVPIIKEMSVIKRNNIKENVSFDKILQRIKKLGNDTRLNMYHNQLPLQINYTLLTMKVIDQLYDEITTTQIDELSAKQSAIMSSIHPDYNILASRIVISNHHKNTVPSFSITMNKLYHNPNNPLVSKELFDFITLNADTIDTICDYNRDYLIDYFGFKTLTQSYLIQINNIIIERPQHMWLRVSIGIHGDNIKKIIETYFYMSQKFMTHATPTLFNAGTPHAQLSSCFLLSIESDSITGILNT